MLYNAGRYILNVKKMCYLDITLGLEGISHHIMVDLREKMSHEVTIM